MSSVEEMYSVTKQGREMVDPEKLMELARVFDNERTKVVGVLPGGIKLSEIIGVQHYEDNTSKVSVSRSGVLYLCWVLKSEAMPAVLRAKSSIKNNPDWHERWEPWELYGSTEPFALKKRLILSRIKTEEERKEAELFY